MGQQTHIFYKCLLSGIRKDAYRTVEYVPHRYYFNADFSVQMVVGVITFIMKVL
jgi:hypothetical protein